MKLIVIVVVSIAAFVGGGLLINRIGYWTRKHRSRMYIGAAILSFLTVVILAASTVRPHPFFVSITMNDARQIRSFSILESPIAISLCSQQVESTILELADERDRLYVAELPYGVGPGVHELELMPRDRLLIGWAYLVVRILPGFYGIVTFTSLMSWLLSSMIVFMVFFAGREGHGPFLRLQADD